MARGRYRKTLAWRADDPDYQLAHRNAQAVYRKIERQLKNKHHPSVDIIIRRLFDNPYWKERMQAQKPKNWKRHFYERRKHKQSQKPLK